MKSPDAGTTMVLGAAVGSVIGVFLDDISMAMGIGAAVGAIVGGILVDLHKVANANSRSNTTEE